MIKSSIKPFVANHLLNIKNLQNLLIVFSSPPVLVYINVYIYHPDYMKERKETAQFDTKTRSKNSSFSSSYIYSRRKQCDISFGTFV